MPKHPPPGRPDDWPASAQARWIRPAQRIFLHLVSRYRIVGQEHLPAEPPYMVVSNHLSYWDIPAMNAVVPHTATGLAARKYKGTWKEYFFELYSVIWVTQFSADRKALRDGITLLKGGGILAIAPEGTRSRTGGLIQGREGPAFIATRAEVPVVPAAVWGTEKIFKHPRPLVTARVGKPFRLPEGRAKGDDLARYTERIMCAIAALMPEQYHGIYAGNPLIEEMRAIVT